MPFNFEKEKIELISIEDLLDYVGRDGEVPYINDMFSFGFGEMRYVVNYQGTILHASNEECNFCNCSVRVNSICRQSADYITPSMQNEMEKELIQKWDRRFQSEKEIEYKILETYTESNTCTFFIQFQKPGRIIGIKFEINNDCEIANTTVLGRVPINVNKFIFEHIIPEIWIEQRLKLITLFS